MKTVNTTLALTFLHVFKDYLTSNSAYNFFWSQIFCKISINIAGVDREIESLLMNWNST